MGGAFGGKETRSVNVAVPVAIAAHILKQPVKVYHLSLSHYDSTSGDFVNHYLSIPSGMSEPRGGHESHWSEAPIHVQIQSWGIQGYRYLSQTYHLSIFNHPAITTGKLAYLEAEVYGNGGCSLDLSGPVLEKVVFQIDGPYKW